MKATYVTIGFDGEIIQIQTTDDSVYNNIPIPTGGQLLEISQPEDPVDYINTNYCLNNNIVAKQKMSVTVSKTNFTANGIDEVTITGIPNGTTAIVTGAIETGPEIITDGELVITSTVVGQIVVSLTLSPNYIEWVGTLNAS